jgi:hypothetical protein
LGFILGVYTLFLVQAGKINSEELKKKKIDIYIMNNLLIFQSLPQAVSLTALRNSMELIADYDLKSRKQK